MEPTRVVILDNGAYSIKAGVAGSDWEPHVVPNSVARSRTEKRVYVGDEIDACRDLSGIVYRRPFDKGMLVNWDTEKTVWDRLFSPSVLNVNTTESSLLVTEPYFNLPNIAETYDQMVFEEYEFQSYYRCPPAALIPYGGLFGDQGPPPRCIVLVDIGYSYSHIVPIKDAQILWDHVKRIDVGGKLLTNHLKHLISFRQWNMMDQTHVVNAVREACCYVSMDWRGDLEAVKRNPRKNAIVQEYVLPDFSPNSTSRTGYIRSGPNAVQETATENGQHGENGHANKAAAEGEEEQVLWMGNERFAGPELLFNPSDIGLKQTGLPETIASVIASLPEELQGMFWANIGLFGGLGEVENLGERLERDLRPLCPSQFDIGIYEAYDPAAQPYHAAQALVSSEIYLEAYPITRAEYLESGSSACRRKFGGPSYNVNPPGFKDSNMGVVVDEDEQELRYALGLDHIKGTRGKRRGEEEEVTSGNWGGRRRRAAMGI